MTALATNLRFGLSDSLVLARRNLSHVRQIPEKLIDVTIQPFTRSVGIATRSRSMVLGGLGGQSRVRGCRDRRVSALAH